jgi:hypothetical protein
VLVVTFTFMSTHHIQKIQETQSSSTHAFDGFVPT